MKKLSVFTILCMLFLWSCQTNNPKTTDSASAEKVDETKEMEAIMKTIEKETSCFYQRDFECWQNCFVHAGHAFQAWNNADGSFDAETGWEAIAERSKNYMKNNPVPEGGSSHPKVERKNMIVKFYGPNTAYLIWDQYNSSPDVKTYTHSKDTRIMEKIDGEWKIVHVTGLWDYKNTIPADSLK